MIPAHIPNKHRLKWLDDEEFLGQMENLINEISNVIKERSTDSNREEIEEIEGSLVDAQHTIGSIRGKIIMRNAWNKTLTI